jgi:hypothetical protein
MKNLALVLLLSFIPLLGFTQKFGVGASGLYNIQSESFGAGVRVSIFPNNRLSYVPQFSYYFIGPVSELTAGLGLEYKIKRGRLLTYYLLAHGGYNQWLNSDASPLENASPANWNAEGGAGITTNRCLRPFLEYRYNIKFRETHVQLGILYIFGCKGAGNQGGGRFGNGYRDPKRVKRTNVCPAY